MARPVGSGFAVSKSISASAASTGRGFLYPTAFIWAVLLGPAGTAGLPTLPAVWLGELQVFSARPVCSAPLASPNRAITGCSEASSDFYSRAGMPIFASPILGNLFMIVVRTITALLVLLAAAPAMSQDRRVPASAAELRLSYAPIVQHVQP